MLDTDGIDFALITGIHGFSIDLSDNSDAGFYSVGSWYHVVISSVTIDAQTVNFVAAAFRIVSVTRGMAGTALPAAAADAAGGLAISDAGGLDLDAKLATATSALATSAALSTAQTDLDTLTGTDGATLATAQANYAPATAAALTTHDGKLDTAQADLDTLTGTDGATLATAQANYAPATAAALVTAQADLDDIQTRLPAALVSGLMSSDVTAISTSTDAADKLEASAETIETGTAQTGTLSTTVMTTDLTEATDDHYIGRIIIWTSGVLLRQATDITDYSGTAGTLTYTAVTEAPSNGDTFVIV